MTDEELDLLASSYLDGQATPQEMAMVERDHELRRRVEELRAVKALLQSPASAPRALKEQQLSAALSAFGGTDRRSSVTAVDPQTPEPAASDDREPGADNSPVVDLNAPSPDGSTGEDPVIDLGAKRRERDANRLRWLSAAAAVAVFSFGAVFLAGQMNSADDSFEAATDAFDEAGEASDAADTATADDGTADDENAVALSEPAAAAEAGEETQAFQLESEELADDAEEDLADGDFAADEAAEGESTEDAADADAIESPIIVEGLPQSGFFPDEPVVTYREVPISDDMVNDLSLRWRQPEASNCAGSVDVPAGAELIAYLPIEVPGDDGDMQLVEALYLIAGRESQVLLVDAATCAAL